MAKVRGEELATEKMQEEEIAVNVEDLRVRRKWRLQSEELMDDFLQMQTTRQDAMKEPWEDASGYKLTEMEHMDDQTEPEKEVPTNSEGDKGAMVNSGWEDRQIRSEGMGRESYVRGKMVRLLQRHSTGFVPNKQTVKEGKYKNVMLDENMSHFGAGDRVWEEGETSKFKQDLRKEDLRNEWWCYNEEQRSEYSSKGSEEDGESKVSDTYQGRLEAIDMVESVLDGKLLELADILGVSWQGKKEEMKTLLGKIATRWDSYMEADREGGNQENGING